jgi:hypothetical protein
MGSAEQNTDFLKMRGLFEQVLKGVKRFTLICAESVR